MEYRFAKDKILITSTCFHFMATYIYWAHFLLDSWLMSNLISLMPVFLNIVELNLNLCLGIATENLTMKRFSFSIRRRNILSVIYVTKSYTQGQDYLSTVCRYVKVVYTRLLLNYFDILHLVLLNKLLIFLQLLF